MVEDAPREELTETQLRLVNQRRLAVALAEARENGIDLEAESVEREREEEAQFLRPFVLGTCCVVAVGLIAAGSVCVDLDEGCGPAA